MLKTANARELLTSKVAALDADLAPIQRAWHFFTAQLTQSRVVQELKDALSEVFNAGGVEGQWREKAMQVLQKYRLTQEPFGTEEEWAKYQNDVEHIDSLARLRLIWRVNVDSAYGITAWTEGMSPQLLKHYPCWEFVRQDGAKDPRPLHVENEGAIRLKWDYNFWAIEMNAAEIGGFELPWPPFGFNSWMQIFSVRADKCPPEFKATIDKMTDEDYRQTAIEADELFGTSLAKAYAKSRGQVSTASLEPWARADLEERLRRDGQKFIVRKDAVQITFDLSKFDKNPAVKPELPENASHKKINEWVEERTGVPTKLSPTRMPRDDARRVATRFVELAEENPKVKVSSFSSKVYKNDYAAAYVQDDKLVVNHDKDFNGYKGFHRAKPYKKALEDEVKYLNPESDRAKEINERLQKIDEGTDFSRFISTSTEKGVSLEDIIVHEFGHLVHNTAIEKAGQRKVLQEMRNALMESRADGFIYKISKYANEDEFEFFAEVYAMQKSGQSLPDYLILFIERMINYAKS